MAKITFTAIVLNQLKVSEGRKEFIDDKPLGVHGSLGLRVSANGEKRWFIRYRVAGKKNPQRLTFSVGYPALGIADAREEARRLLIDIQNGIDPNVERKVEKEAITFLELCEHYLLLHAERKKRPKSIRDDRNKIHGSYLQPWHHRKAKDISRKNVIALLDKISETAPVNAGRYRALLSKIYNFAIERDLDTIDQNPAYRVPNPDPKTKRNRVLKDSEIQIFWKSIASHRFNHLFKIMLLTGQRSQEVARMQWQNIDFKEKTWLIPAVDSKNKIEHLVPLSLPVVQILTSLNPQGQGYVFPSRKTSSKPFTSVESRDREHLRKLTGIEDFRPHDLRRTMTTNLGKLRFSRFIQDKVTNHVDNSVGGIYDRYDYFTEKREALDAWAEHLLNIVEQE